MNLVSILQVVVAVGLLNVWLLRFSKPTSYRGGSAKNLKEEFAAYGLPSWSCYLVGSLKIGSAIALLIGLQFPLAALAASSLVSLLMLGAIAMHLKVKDPMIKSVPALAMLSMSALIAWTQYSHLA